jgi:hypothetical protein
MTEPSGASSIPKEIDLVPSLFFGVAELRYERAEFGRAGFLPMTDTQAEGDGGLGDRWVAKMANHTLNQQRQFFKLTKEFNFSRANHA